MKNGTIQTVKVNLPKFRQLRGDESLATFAPKIGLKPDMLSKIERGERWTTLHAFAEYCERTGQEPNTFFEISTKKSAKTAK